MAGVFEGLISLRGGSMVACVRCHRTSIVWLVAACGERGPNGRSGLRAAFYVPHTPASKPSAAAALVFVCGAWAPHSSRSYRTVLQVSEQPAWLCCTLLAVLRAGVGPGRRDRPGAGSGGKAGDAAGGAGRAGWGGGVSGGQGGRAGTGEEC